MDREGHIDLKNIAAVIFCVGAAAFGIWIFLKYALGILMPFILAWLISLATRPLSMKISEKIGIPQKPIAALLLLVVVAVLVGVTAWGINRAALELEGLLSSLDTGNSMLGSFMTDAADWASNLSMHLPLPEALKNSPQFEDFWLRLDESVMDSVMSGISSVCERLPGMAFAVAKALPSVLLFVTVLLLSGYYFSVGDVSVAGAVQGMVCRIFPSVKNKIEYWQASAKDAARRYIRAYLLLMLITFAEMFIGFSLLKIEYAFILAWGVAIVDLLPVLGTGTVLIPWTIISFISGDHRIGTGLLVIYGISIIIRQVIEPKIVGKSLGLPPFVSLVSMYIGFKLLGVWGMILSPAVAMVIRGVIAAGLQGKKA